VFTSSASHSGFRAALKNPDRSVKTLECNEKISDPTITSNVELRSYLEDVSKVAQLIRLVRNTYSMPFLGCVQLFCADILLLVLDSCGSWSFDIATAM
jgi:hypothetical protein